MVHYLTDAELAERHASRERVALRASLWLSSLGVVVALMATVWADAQHINFADLPLGGVSGDPLVQSRAQHFLLFLVLMFICGVIALILAFVGARSVTEQPGRAVLAGAMAMAVVMIPVVIGIFSVINHWYTGD